jgi:lysophospholipase L1-like esterase
MSMLVPAQRHSALIRLFVLVLLGSSAMLAQNAPVRAASEPCQPAQMDAWHVERERLLHNDWANLERFHAANAALPAPTVDAPRVVMMGDSITEGWRDTITPQGPEMGAFFSGKPYINRGISGQTTPQMLVRFRQDVIELRPAVVVILAGTNDIAGNTGETTLEAIEDNFATMCELARAHGIRVVLASVLPAADFPWRPGRHPAPQIAALNRWLQSYAAANHHIYLDFYTPTATDAGAFRPDLSEDGVHPNKAGYKVMAPLLEKAIAAAVQQK